MNDLLLQHARIVLQERVIEHGSLAIAGQRIVRVSDADETEHDHGIDLTGCTLFPGFIDVHIHGAAGVDVMNAGVEELGSVSRFLATQGVTTWLPTFVPAAAEEYRHAVDVITQCLEARHDHEAQIAGLHYEGPFVNTAQCGALHTEHFRTYSEPSDVSDLPVPEHSSAVRMITVAPEIEGGIELVRELRQRGWVISIGHTRADEQTLDRAAAAGAHHMTHFMNAMAPVHHRAPGPIAWGLSRDDVSCDLIADGIHLDPFMLRLLVKLKSPGRLALISDAIAAAGMGDGDYQVWGETISVRDGRTRNVHGSIAGSVITMCDAVRMMLSLGVAEPDVARMASLNPAQLLGLAADRGAIEAGKRADLVALDDRREVRLVVIGGAVAYDAHAS